MEPEEIKSAYAQDGRVCNACCRPGRVRCFYCTGQTGGVRCGCCADEGGCCGVCAAWLLR